MGGMRVAAVVVVAAMALAGFVAVLFTVIRRHSAHVIGQVSEDPDTIGATTTVAALMEAGQSESGGQLNGVGVLAMFPTEIRFVLGVPHRTIVIPHSAIGGATVTKHLKLPGIRRAGGPPYLLVTWKGPHGVHTTAFQTASADELLAGLQSAEVVGREHPDEGTVRP